MYMVAWVHTFDQKFITLSHDFGHQEQLFGIFLDKLEAENCSIVLKCLKQRKIPISCWKTDKVPRILDPYPVAVFTRAVPVQRGSNTLYLSHIFSNLAWDASTTCSEEWYRLFPVLWITWGTCSMSTWQFPNCVPLWIENSAFLAPICSVNTAQFCYGRLAGG